MSEGVFLGLIDAGLTKIFKTSKSPLLPDIDLTIDIDCARGRLGKSDSGIGGLCSFSDRKGAETKRWFRRWSYSMNCPEKFVNSLGLISRLAKIDAVLASKVSRERSLEVALAQYGDELWPQVLSLQHIR